MPVGWQTRAFPRVCDSGARSFGLDPPNPRQPCAAESAPNAAPPGAEYFGLGREPWDISPSPTRHGGSPLSQQERARG